MIPSRPRHKLGMKKDTRGHICKAEGQTTINPITDDYIRKMAGMAGTKGKLLRALMGEKAKQRKL